MQCQFCHKRAATIHLTEIADGERTEMHVCENCANELLSNLLAVQPTDDDLLGSSEHDLTCPHCGFTLDKFRKEPVLGCSYDYDVFEKSLLPLIEKAQGGMTYHCGKVPSRMPKQSRKQIERSRLQQQLDIAVRNEDYELAAQLRDKMNQIE
jgi:protein arginine kinase activator